MIGTKRLHHLKTNTSAFIMNTAASLYLWSTLPTLRVNPLLGVQKGSIQQNQNLKWNQLKSMGWLRNYSFPSQTSISPSEVCPGLVSAHSWELKVQEVQLREELIMILYDFSLEIQHRDQDCYRSIHNMAITEAILKAALLTPVTVPSLHKSCWQQKYSKLSNW